MCTYPANADAMPTNLDRQKIDAAVTVLTSFLERVHKKYRKPVWLTDFSLVIYDINGIPTATSREVHPQTCKRSFCAKQRRKRHGLCASLCNVQLFDSNKHLANPLGIAFQALL